MKLEIEGAAKSFGAKKALDGVDLTVDGGLFGLLGMNGAGKSTLFRAILGLMPLDGGKIAVGGLEVARHSLEIRKRVGYLPEEPLLEEKLTGGETLELVAALKEVDPGGEERRELLELFELAAARDVLVGNYSLGMRKKLALIVALLGRPKLLLLDEPLNALDAASMRRLREHLEMLAAAGSTIVFSSHYLSFAERLCSRIALLHLGRKVAEGSPQELRSLSGLGSDAAFDDVFLELALR
jgi:ABC-2 type transport system ATP-binding protein